ncbi:MAG: NAD(P)H-dependent oxidoreductase subunit E [Dehalococcoidia bacterium]|nr:NAD(P)H-dependent oxidoreductase subunit E [Dehalococcoidia bacterium]
MLETEATLEIKQLVSEFKPGDADLLPALHKVQHRYGYIPKEAIGVVARQLRLGEAHVYGAVTFYSELRETPPPATRIDWCSGPACRLKGGENMRLVLEAELGIGMEQNTPGDKLGLHLAQCNGTCEFAPQLWVAGKVVGPLTVSETIRLAREMKGAQ